MDELTQAFVPPSRIDLAREADFVLGALLVRPSRRELEAGGARRVLQRRVMQVLVALAQSNSEVVSQRELIVRCWDGLSVSDDAIVRCIGQLRRLAASWPAPPFEIKTIAGVGYRLDAAARNTSEATTKSVLAVLAFDNLSGDPEVAYFSDGVSEEILQAIARIPAIRVIGRSSSFQFRGADKAADRVAAALKVTHVLDGSVRRSGNAVRVFAQLIECSGQTTLWSDRFDRELQDIFALQDEIAAAVAAGLKATFVAARATEPIDPVAYDLYLKARPRAGQEDATAAERISLLEAAVRLAPDFAAAWAELAHTRAVVHRGVLRDKTVAAAPRSAAVSAAETALRLDPMSGTAHAALATLLPWGDYVGREALLQKALVAAPSATRALVDISWFLTSVGRNEAALSQACRALEIDPLDRGAASIKALMLCATGRYAEGLRAFDAARKKSAPWSLYAPMHLAAFRHDWARFEQLRLAAERIGYSGREIGGAVLIAKALREPTPENRARFVDRIRRQLADTGTVQLGSLAVAYDMGLDDEVFSFVEEASFDHLNDQSGVAPGGSYSAGFIFDRSARRSMMLDVRFVRLCAKLGLCSYWVRSGRWPDCVDFVAYDFKAECRRLTTAA